MKLLSPLAHRLEHFYIDLGFTRSDVYLEDNIDHIQMFIPES